MSRPTLEHERFMEYLTNSRVNAIALSGGSACLVAGSGDLSLFQLDGITFGPTPAVLVIAAGSDVSTVCYLVPPKP